MTHWNKKLALKLALILIPVFLFAILGSYYVGYNEGRFNTHVPEARDIVEGSYIIWNDDTTVYAKNGRTGEIDFTDQNASGVIQSAIDAMASTRRKGEILLKAGTYNITNSIMLRGGGIRLVGEGISQTTLKASKDLQANIIEFVPIDERESFDGLRDLQIWGAARSGGTVGHGIYVSTVLGGLPSDFSIEQVYVRECAQDGMHLENVWGFKIMNCISEHNLGEGLFMKGSRQATIINSFIAYNEGTYGLSIRTGTDNVIVQSCTIYQNMKTGVFIGGAGNVLTSNVIRNNSQATVGGYSGLWLDTSGNHTLVNANVIEGDSQQLYGIYMLSNDNIVTANQIDWNSVQIFNNGTGNIISNNEGQRAH